ncbi:MAG: sigma-70 family RNA polymerase sigma factor [Eubacterium sp.]|nr:sigma-70 family RNA polymerase sigma factor [Eubacterium sp.]
MNRTDSERITTEYLKPVFGFALKRCKNLEDAEDLAQDIIAKIFIALCKCDNIEDISSYIWTIAHNCLSNYYRNNNYSFSVIPIDDVADHLYDNSPSVDLSLIEHEEIAKLHTEIAHLSKLQRRIVIMYYYENKKQEKIAEELSISVGTVKWHLFETKKELKRGMKIMRQPSELKFNPIKFEMCTFSGKIGTKGDISNFFRSAISQNIVYTVKNEAKTINEIADELGVSPVYVESEAEYLEEYGFLLKQKNKYLCNILISEPTEQLNRLQDEMYMKAARIFANELYDELMNLDLLHCDGIIGGYNDVNFLMWALIPFIASFSGENTMDNSIAFSDVYTIRPDGGKNICYASVESPDIKPPMYNEEMKHFRGPFWNGLTDKITLWTIDSEWSKKRIDENYQLTVVRDLTLLNNLFNDVIMSDDDYAYLAEKGYISVSGKIDELFKATLKIVYIKDEETRKKLLSIGDRIKEKHKTEFEELKEPYIKAVLENTPKHLHKMRMYGLQHIFYSDAWFILHCLKELINNDKLTLSTKKQKQALTTIIFNQ